MAQRKRKEGPKILTADIETLPIEAYTWHLFDEPRILDRLAKDWAIFSCAAKWFGDRNVQYANTQSALAVDDDLELLKWVRELLDEADIVVGQNAQKFDMRKIRARMIHHGLRPFREPQIVDTLLMAKEVGAFTSNKLEYLSTLTGGVKKSAHTKYPGFKLWAGIIKDDPGAWAEVKKYNRDDVLATEEVYTMLRPWARRHPNVAQYYLDEEMRCPRCGAKELQTTGTLHRGVSTYTAYVCGACGGHSRSRYTENSLAKRKGLLTCV